eukprot:1157780-Pelagomonas_calceolata.AAC.19
MCGAAGSSQHAHMETPALAAASDHQHKLPATSPHQAHSCSDLWPPAPEQRQKEQETRSAAGACRTQGESPRALHRLFFFMQGFGEN